MNSTERDEIIQEILSYRCPRYEHLPNIPLYSDQVVDALTQYTAPFYSNSGEQAITATMINNYVKQRLITPPVKKRYDREQIARLYCICLLKRVFSISEVKRLLEVQMCSYPFPQAYDYFCVELEKALQAAFSNRDFSAPSSATRVTAESELVRLSALTFANKLFAVKFLQLYDMTKQDGERI